MGLIIPWILRALSGAGMNARFSVWLYAINTLGGVFGLGATLLFTLPAFGLTVAGGVNIAVNLFVAISAVFLALSQKRAGNEMALKPQPISTDAETGNAIGGDPALLAFLSGFLVLALEVVLQHQLAQVSINPQLNKANLIAVNTALPEIVSRDPKNVSFQFFTEDERKKLEADAQKAQSQKKDMGRPGSSGPRRR